MTVRMLLLSVQTFLSGCHDTIESLHKVMADLTLGYAMTCNRLGLNLNLSG